MDKVPPTPDGQQPAKSQADAAPSESRPAASTPTPPQTPQAASQGSFYKPEASASQSESSAETNAPDQTGQSNSGEDEAITWTASEYISHHKSFGWYLGVVVVTLLLVVIAFVLTHDFVVAAVLLILGIAFSVYGSHQPRQLQYSLSATGLQVANKFFPFDNFRSFALVEDGAFGSIIFAPLKRFGQLVTIYFDPADGERIVNVLSNNLPLEPRRQDPLDQLMRRIHF